MGIGSGATHLVTIRIEESFKINDVRMGDESHDLQFTVLGRRGDERRSGAQRGKREVETCLEPLVLQDLLDCDVADGV